MKNYLLIVLGVFSAACILCFNRSYNTLSAAEQTNSSEVTSSYKYADTTDDKNSIQQKTHITSNNALRNTKHKSACVLK